MERFIAYSLATSGFFVNSSLFEHVMFLECNLLKIPTARPRLTYQNNET